MVIDGATISLKKRCIGYGWMEMRILRRFIEHAGHSREKRLPEGLVVDGYSQPRPDENHKDIVLQFHGCFWHGCPRCFRINRDTALTSGD